MPESVKEKSNGIDLQKEIDKVNGYKYSQSSKGSELIRKIVFAIIGSCWILMFANGKYQDTNVFLKVTIACSFIYLLLDVTHYLWDTCSYHAHAQNMVQCTSSDYFENVYKPADVKITQRSFVFFISKVAACFAVSAAFLLGMFIEPLYGEKNEQSSKKTQVEGQKALSQGKWGYTSVDDGYEWTLYTDHSESPQQILTVRFDDQSNVRDISFSSEQ